jgi:hypothetical protein
VQYLQPHAKALYPAPAKQPLNARERAAAGKPSLPLAQYHAARPLDLSNHVGGDVEVVLPVEELARGAHNAKKRFIWGDKIYTADTDLFAAIVHQALVPSKCTESGFGWPDAVRHVRAIVRVWPPQRGYRGTLRNGLRSRGWPNKCFEFAYSIERAWLVVQVVRSLRLALAYAPLQHSLLVRALGWCSRLLRPCHCADLLPCI